MLTVVIFGWHSLGWFLLSSWHLLQYAFFPMSKCYTCTTKRTTLSSSIKNKAQSYPFIWQTWKATMSGKAVSGFGVQQKTVHTIHTVFCFCKLLPLWCSGSRRRVSRRSECRASLDHLTSRSQDSFTHPGVSELLLHSRQCSQGEPYISKRNRQKSLPLV